MGNMERPRKKTGDKTGDDVSESVAPSVQNVLAVRYAEMLNSQLALIKFQESGGFPMITALEVKPLIERSLEIMNELTSGSVESDEDALRQELAMLREKIVARNSQLLKEMGEIDTRRPTDGIVVAREKWDRRADQ